MAMVEHQHCYSCVRSSCTDGHGCPMDDCPEGCGAKMHRCKTREHQEHICPEFKVPCVNAVYGCRQELKRKSLMSHLSHCPASVLQCTFLYCRRSAKGQRRFDQTGASACSSIDEGEVGGGESGEVESGEEEMDTSEDEEVSLTVSGAGTESPLMDIQLYQDDCRNLEISKGDQSIDVDGVVSPPSLSLLNPHQGLNLVVTTGAGCKQLPDTAFREMKRFYGHLDWWRPAYKHKFLQNCAVVCNQVIRRDEFSTHWKNLHLDLHYGMSQIIQRCPMACYGCSHGQVSQLPSPKGASVRYDRQYETFLHAPPRVTADKEECGGLEVRGAYTARVAQLQELSLFGYHGDTNGSPDVLGQLPLEVLLMICRRLDSLSLWFLSQVNWYLREVCFNTVAGTKGVVYSVWTLRDEGWTLGPKVWTFSKVFSPIPSWHYSASTRALGHHMTTSCKLFQSQVEPYQPNVMWDISSERSTAGLSVSMETTSYKNPGRYTTN